MGSLIENVSSFCHKYDIEITVMEDVHVIPGQRVNRRVPKVLYTILNM